jgi:hypothetical protein
MSASELERIVDTKRIFMSCLVPLVLVGCSKGVGENGASSDTLQIATSTTIMNETTTLVTIDPYANEDLVWIADTCEAEQKNYELLMDVSRTADNPEIAGQELDFLDGDAVKVAIGDYYDAWNDLDEALQTVGKSSLGLSARENAGLGHFASLPTKAYYPHVQNEMLKWFYPLDKIQIPHEDVAHYCLMLPPRP